MEEKKEGVIESDNVKDTYSSEKIFDDDDDDEDDDDEDNDDDDDEEKLDKDEVQMSIYQGVETDEEKVRKRTKAEEEWEWQMKCTQDWFIRSSWINKFLFIEALCKSTNGTKVLETILKKTGLIFAKDVVQSLAKDNTSFFYDRIPIDDNRALREADLKNAMKNDFLWFVNLQTSRQISVILRLLKLGGGGLIFFIHKKVKKLFEERQSFYSLISAVPSTLCEAKAPYSTLKSGKNSKIKTSKISFEEGNEKLDIKEHTKRNLEELERRKAELLKYKKSKDISGRDSKPSKKVEPKEVIDYLQIMPIGLNRKIMSYIDEKTLSELKKVGRYWGKMIDESINEKSGRKAINAKINKIIGLKSYGESKEYEEKKNNIDDEETMEEEEEMWEQVKELGSKKLLSDKNKNEKAMLTAAKTSEEIFSQKHHTIKLECASFANRFCCLDKNFEKLASPSSSSLIHFYSTRTGARLKFSVFGFDSPVTCIDFHEDRIHVFVGLKDGTILGKNFRTNETRASIKGHSQPIKALFTTSLNLLSSAADNTIKYFQLWSCVCLLCLDLSSEFNISSVLMKIDRKTCCIVGTNEGVLILIDIEKKSYLNKIRLHWKPIKFLAQDEDILITGTQSGNIRVWNLKKFENSKNVLTPYYDINLVNNLTCLTLHESQIFIGLDNGNLKIISLANGKVFKSLNILDKKISGLVLAEDKFCLKVIIWSEEGIEIKSFPLLNSPFNKKSIKSLNRKDEKEKYKMGETIGTSDIPLAGFVKNNKILSDPITYRKTTFQGTRKKPLSERCCTVFTLRTKQKKHENIKTDIFTKIVNENNLLPTKDAFVETFTRCKYTSPTKK